MTATPGAADKGAPHSAQDTAQGPAHARQTHSYLTPKQTDTHTHTHIHTLTYAPHTHTHTETEHPASYRTASLKSRVGDPIKQLVNRVTTLVIVTWHCQQDRE